VTDVLFYHLQRQPLEAVLPALLVKSLERGWKVVVQGVTEERLSLLDDHLWTYSEESFLPHGTDKEAGAADQPVLLTLQSSNANGANVRFLLEGADLPAAPEAYQRIVILFDGNDDDALARAREQWRLAKAAGLEGTYWQQDDNGRWERKA
jgi:DNA polymerase-3 subunit chi